MNTEDCAPCELKTLSEQELNEVDVDSLKEELESFEEKLKSMKPNMASIEDFR